MFVLLLGHHCHASDGAALLLSFLYVATVIPCCRCHVVVALAICVTSSLSLCWCGTGRLHHVIVVMLLWVCHHHRLAMAFAMGVTSLLGRGHADACTGVVVAG